MTQEEAVKLIEDFLPQEAWPQGYPKIKNVEKTFLRAELFFGGYDMNLVGRKIYKVYHFSRIPCNRSTFEKTYCLCFVVDSKGKIISHSRHLPCNPKAACRNFGKNK